MHILIIPSAYPTEDAPLRSTFFREQAVALVKKGHKVGVVYSETRRLTSINIKMIKKNHFNITIENDDGVNTLRLHGWNILMMRNKLGINLWINQSLYLFKRYIEMYGKPDLIHVHMGLYGGMVGKIIKEKYNIPYVITEHSSVVMNGFMNNYQKYIIEESYRNADALISVGKKLRDSMRMYTHNNINIIPNIVNTDKFKYDDSKKNNEFTFISVCNLKKDKNIELLLKAYSNVFNNKSNTKLIIIGDGEEKERLLKLSNELNINDNVEFVGAVLREQLHKYLESSSVFVLPSKYETFGVAYIEAMSCGLPIITTKCGGPEDFYNEYLGYMIEEANVKCLEEAMLKMITNYGQFNRSNISRYIKESFSEEVIVHRLNEVYKKIL